MSPSGWPEDGGSGDVHIAFQRVETVRELGITVAGQWKLMLKLTLSPATLPLLVLHKNTSFR